MKHFEENLRQKLGYEVLLTAHHQSLRYWTDASDEIKRLLMLQEDFSFKYQCVEDKYIHLQASYERPYIGELIKEFNECKLPKPAPA